MGQIKQEDVTGLVRNSDKTYTAVVKVGTDPKTGKDILSRKKLDKEEASSLMKRLDKDRSRMEKEGTRAKEREPERRPNTGVASRQSQNEFLRQFKKNG